MARHLSPELTETSYTPSPPTPISVSSNSSNNLDAHLELEDEIKMLELKVTDDADLVPQAVQVFEHVEPVTEAAAIVDLVLVPRTRNRNSNGRGLSDISPTSPSSSVTGVDLRLTSPTYSSLVLENSITDVSPTEEAAETRKREDVTDEDVDTEEDKRDSEDVDPEERKEDTPEVTVWKR